MKYFLRSVIYIFILITAFSLLPHGVSAQTCVVKKTTCDCTFTTSCEACGGGTCDDTRSICLTCNNTYSVPENTESKGIIGLDCGVPNTKGNNFTTSDNDKINVCCAADKSEVPKAPREVEGLPLIGDYLRAYNTKALVMETIRNRYGNKPCFIGSPEIEGSSCTCKIDTNESTAPVLANRCRAYIKNIDEKNSCILCVNGGGMWTGIGCIPLTLNKFITSFLLGWGIGLAGLTSLFCIIYSVFIMQTSRGNPERIKKAQEFLTSCIMGLLLIIFSVIILRIVGYDIMRIPFLK